MHIPGDASVSRVLEGPGKWIIGRDPAADLSIQHGSVSRRHAQLERDAHSWGIVDLGSKNGMRVEGDPCTRAELTRRTWLAVGDVFCEFDLLDPQSLGRIRERVQQRLHTSAAWHERVSIAQGVDTLLAHVLEGMVALAECRRGFLLLGDGNGPLRLGGRHDLDAEDPEFPGFSGSRSVVRRAMLERRPIFLSDCTQPAWLKGAASVVGQGLRALACVPLVNRGNILGAVYVDTDEESKLFTDLDAELMVSFAERASAALALSDLESEIRGLESAFGDWGESRPGSAP